ncbi:MAG: 30S ribosomal protein S5 [Candidatus Diapherotrites archaeon]|nr:30S ribosomal protein S5 [Candidatus Diapherotrites archaeon]
MNRTNPNRNNPNRNNPNKSGPKGTFNKKGFEKEAFQKRGAKELDAKKLEDEVERRLTDRERKLDDWTPKTETGRLVKAGSVESYDQLLSRNLPVLEPEIIDCLLPELESKMIDVSKTTRVTRSGRNFSFRATVLVGDKSGFIGIGTGKDKERWPAMRKAEKNAKLGIKKISKGCGSWECSCGLNHTVPFATTGKAASVKLKLLPAPRGTGLVVGSNIKDVFNFVGINDVWSKSFGNTRTTLNYVKAAVDALAQLQNIKSNKFFEAKVKN